MQLKQQNFASNYELPSDSPGFLLWQVTNTWQRKQRATLKTVDLTHVQFVLLTTLAWLSKDGQRVTQTVLSQHAKTDVMMTSQVVRTLVAKNLMTRVQHPVDTRANVLALTQAGHDVMERAIRLVEQVDSEFFACLGTETAKIITLFHKLLREE